MQVLVVTGGLGFIGSNFIHRIMRSREEFRVINIDNASFGSNLANLREIEKKVRYRFVKGDLSDYNFAVKALRGADVVVNFAAQTHVDRSISSPQIFFESNTRAAFNVVRSVLANKVGKFIHISTDEIYGSIKKGSFDENSRLHPSSPYSATKASADLLVQAWAATFNLPAIILRCTNNFGPRQHPEKLIPKTIIRALRHLPIPLYGGGKQIRDWIYVDDFCSAVELAMDHGERGQIYNISAKNEVTNRLVVTKILKQLDIPISRILKVEDRPGHDFRYSLNSRKAQKEMGWRPFYSLDDALARTVRWYQDHEAWWTPLVSHKVLSETPWKERW